MRNKTVEEIFNDMSYGPAPESIDIVEQWLKSHQDGFGFYINGEWVSGSANSYFDSLNPANGNLLGKVAQGNSDDIDKAVRSARGALEPWQKIGCHGRARYLYALARLV